MIKKISYLGLGTMGSGMVSNLLKAGYELTVWNRSIERNKPLCSVSGFLLLWYILEHMCCA